jgi:hypothetical protein
MRRIVQGGKQHQGVDLMKWYHERKKNAKDKFLQGYYPKHVRTPNLIVCWLYEVGYFFGDFVPLVMNLIEGIYQVIRRMIAFVVTILIEASTGIVLLGTILFSVFHSIEFLRRSGAVGGLEYIGVFMFEVVFISSTATLTASLMRKERPNPFSIIGFLLGIAFVEISNITAMNSTWEGIAIGAATPILLIIAEGILAYQYMRSQKSEQRLTNPEQEDTEQNEQATEQNKQIEQTEQMTSEQNTQTEQTEQPRTKSNKQINIEQTDSEQTKVQDKQDHVNAQEVSTEHRTAEQKEVEHDIEQKQKSNIEQSTTEQPSTERSNFEQKNSEQDKPNNKRRTKTKKSNTKLYVVSSNKTPSKTEQAYQYVIKLIEQNEDFTVRSVAEAIGCSPSTAQTAINRAKEKTGT